MHKQLAVGQPSMGLYADEGGMFVGGSGMAKENVLKTAAGLSHLWDGKPVKRLRAGDGASTLFGRRVSLHLMVQVGVATVWLADETLRDQGLFSRLLIAAPESLAGTRMYREPGEGARSAIDRFGARVLSILERPYRTVEGKPNVLDPRRLVMTEQACGIWRAFGDAVESKLGPSGKLRPVSGLANKIPEHAARLAAVLSLFENLDVEELDAHALSRGIKLAEWYLGEALRLADAGHVSDDVRLAEATLAWLQETWPVVAGVQDGGRLFSVPDLYQLGPNAIRTKEVAMRALAVLLDHGWIVKVEGPHKVRGVLRRDVYSMKGA